MDPENGRFYLYARMGRHLFFWRKYLKTSDVFDKLDRLVIFDDHKDFFTDDKITINGLIAIFVCHAQPETTTTVNPEAIPSTGIGYAVIAGTFAIA